MHAIIPAMPTFVYTVHPYNSFNIKVLFLCLFHYTLCIFCPPFLLCMKMYIGIYTHNMSLGQL